MDGSEVMELQPQEKPKKHKQARGKGHPEKSWKDSAVEQRCCLKEVATQSPHETQVATQSPPAPRTTHQEYEHHVSKAGHGWPQVPRGSLSLTAREMQIKNKMRPLSTWEKTACAEAGQMDGKMCVSAWLGRNQGSP